jgi:hypothetical protein
MFGVFVFQSYHRSQFWATKSNNLEAVNCLILEGDASLMNTDEVSDMLDHLSPCNSYYPSLLDIISLEAPLLNMHQVWK